MNTSVLIARFIGPVMLVAGAAMLVNREAIRAVVDDIVAHPAFLFLSDVLALPVGVAIITFHNDWALGWPLIITVYGWLALVAGVVRTVFPQVAKRMGAVIIGNDAALMATAVANVLLGGFLTYMGFMA